MRTEWVREPHPVNPAEFTENGTGLIRVLLPGQRLVQVATDGQWYVEFGGMRSEPGDFPLFARIARQPAIGQALHHWPSIVTPDD